ncbi:MAG: prepilin-type N-terminal cleavage/methylation domain-containing protein [Deltaproteobacteria bacterium]|nr:prepilin-type N-terminal cleavage/methylation domain-containing protein [Deltaproteobacteria bacterium]
MLPKAFSQALRLRKKPRGYTLIELLVVLLITSFMMTTITGFFQTAVATRQNAGAQTEAQQGLRALASLITQELRQAGACLPRNGNFMALAGTKAVAGNNLPQ